MRTVHFEPTISAAPATEQVGAAWTGSIVRVATTGLYGPTRPTSGRFSPCVERGHERARDLSREVSLRDTRDAVEDLRSPVVVEPSDRGEAAVERADAGGVPAPGPPEGLVSHIGEAGALEGIAPRVDLEGERRAPFDARTGARVDPLQQGARRRDERIRLSRNAEQRPPEGNP